MAFLSKDFTSTMAFFGFDGGFSVAQLRSPTMDCGLFVPDKLYDSTNLDFRLSASGGLGVFLLSILLVPPRRHFTIASRWVAGLPFSQHPKIQAYLNSMARLCSMIAWNGE